MSIYKEQVTEKLERIEQEAYRLVNGPRNDDYSHPYDDFNRTALIWTAILGKPVTAKQVALCMIGVKLSRETHKHKRDNLVDIIGYTLTEEMVIEKEKEICRQALNEIDNQRLRDKERQDEFNDLPTRPL